MSTKDLTTSIDSYYAAGKERDDIIVALFNDHAVSINTATKAVAKYWKDNGLTTTKVGFTKLFQDWLLDATPSKPRTEAQALKFMEEHGSENTLRHKNYFLNERALVEAAFKKGLASK